MKHEKPVLNRTTKSFPLVFSQFSIFNKESKNYFLNCTCNDRMN